MVARKRRAHESHYAEGGGASANDCLGDERASQATLGRRALGTRGAESGDAAVAAENGTEQERCDLRVI